MNCAELVFVIPYTNSAQFIGGSNDLITFFFGGGGVKRGYQGGMQLLHTSP